MKNIDFVELIRDFLLDEMSIKNILDELNGLKDKEKYRLELGKVLYSNGLKKQGYIVTPYNIEVDKHKNFSSEISFCYGDEINSADYASKSVKKEPVLIMNGYIFFVSGQFSESDGQPKINNANLLKWPTDIQLNELKKKVGFVSSRITYQKTDFDNEKFEGYNGETYKEYEDIKTHKVKVSNLGRVMVDNVIFEPQEDGGLLCIFENIAVHRLIGETFLEKPLGFSSQIHHIDNNGYNNNINNLLNITYEQHASIHLYMWNNYKFCDGILKNR
jgi:hypothetical protein